MLLTGNAADMELFSVTKPVEIIENFVRGRQHFYENTLMSLCVVYVGCRISTYLDIYYFIEQTSTTNDNINHKITIEFLYFEM